MASDIAANDIVEVTIRARQDGQRVINQFRYLCQTAGTGVSGAVELADIASLFDVSVGDAIRSLQSNTIVERKIRAQKIQTGRYRYIEIDSATPAGAVSGTPLPSGNSMVVRRQAETSSRKDAGRIYVPGLVTSQVSGSKLTDAALANAESTIPAALTASLATPSGGSYLPVLFEDFPPFRHGFVVSCHVDPIVRYQRRREVGKGE